MAALTADEKRQQMLAATERDEHELEAAVADLQQALRRPLAVAERVQRHIATDAHTWLAASALVGFWLGRRAR